MPRCLAPVWRAAGAGLAALSVTATAIASRRLDVDGNGKVNLLEILSFQPPPDDDLRVPFRAFLDEIAGQLEPGEGNELSHLLEGFDFVEGKTALEDHMFSYPSL